MNITFLPQYEHINNCALRCCSVVNSIIQRYGVSWALFMVPGECQACRSVWQQRILTFCPFSQSVFFLSFNLPHLSLLLFPFFFHAVGNWSSGWIDLYRCGHCRSDGSARSCVNEASVCLHAYLAHQFLPAFFNFASHDLRALIREISSLFHYSMITHAYMFTHRRRTVSSFT